MTLVKNNRLGDHPDPGDTYLRHVKTTVDGSYEATSMDPNARQQIKAHSTDDGSYVVTQTEGSGETNQSSTGGVKTHFDSSTTTTTGHSDNNTGGGSSSRTAGGGNNENAKDTTNAVDGSSQQASSSSSKNYTQGGDGHHSMNGDQTFIVEEGSMSYEVGSGYAITGHGACQFNFDQDISVHSGTNFGLSTISTTSMHAGSDINISSDTSITLSVGGSSIVITNSGILLKTTTGTITIESENGNQIISKSGGTQIEAGTSPPLPWSGS